MEQKSKVVGIIPARYGSSRFPGKVLAKLLNKPMIQWVYEFTMKSKSLDQLLVAVDDIRVKQCVEDFGGTAIMTKSDHQSGTDRIAEAVENIEADIIVNIQGDQPLFDAVMIDECVEPMLNDDSVLMSTIKTKINEEDFYDPAIVKVVVDENDDALYFSRSLIPFSREKQQIDVYEHVGLYAYRKDFLLKISQMPQSNLEKIEMLEQLRVLEKGYKIRVVNTSSNRSRGVSVDTPDDLIRVKKIMQDMDLNL